MINIKNVLPYLSGIGLALIFGFSFLFTKEALNGIAPFHLLALRFGTAALVMTLLKLAKIIKIDYSGKNLKILLVIALVQPVSYFVFETTGLRIVSTSEAGIMIALIPIAVTIFAAVFLKEIPSKLQAASVALSVLGVILIVFFKYSNGTNTNIIGIILMFFAVLSGSVFNILSRKSSADFKPVEITFFILWTGAIVFNCIAVFQHILKANLTHYFIPLTNIKVLTSVLYLGILSSIVAFFLINYTLSKLEASRSSVFAHLSSIISILAGVIIRHEPFYWFQLVGAVFILTGVWGTNYFSIKVKKRSHNAR